MNDIEKGNYKQLQSLAIKEGAVLFGVADIRPHTEHFFLSKEELEGLSFGISIGLTLSPSVLNGIIDQPTILYKWHYRQANNLLDKIAFKLTQHILQKNYRALPVPSSQIIDWKKQYGHLSHRSLAEAAGLGWRGRNNLTVNDKYGARIRLVSILTDMPLEVDTPQESQCGTCRLCIESCPAGALGDTPAEYNMEKCYKLLREFSKIQGVGQMICGICVKACSGKGSN